MSVTAAFLVLHAGQAAVFTAALALFSFAWVFLPPYHVPVLIELDESRSSLMLLTARNFWASRAVPCSVLCLGREGATGAVKVSMTLFGLAILALLAARATMRRYPAAKVPADVEA